MNRTQILSKLRKALGPKAGYRYDPRAPDADERAELRARSADLRAKEVAAKEALEAKRQELLLDPEYQRLRAEWIAAEAARSEVTFRLVRSRCEALRPLGIGNVVEAQGDSWPEVFAQLEARHR